MAKGIGRIDVSSPDAGKVLVLLDDQSLETMSATQYAVTGIEPPIYELATLSEYDGRHSRFRPVRVAPSAASQRSA